MQRLGCVSLCVVLLGFGIGASSALASSAPVIVSETVTDVHSDAAILHAVISPSGASTKYQFEYGAARCAESACTKVPGEEVSIGSARAIVSQGLEGLTPGTTYYWRVKAKNSKGQSFGLERTFSTYGFEALHTDNCPNAHVRQQTSAAFLLDCRAYELVSAANTGGYDVESNLVGGQSPFADYPQASRASGASRLLYGIHSGAIPGVEGDPTNNGLDPYLATRGEDEWSTKYVGIPADDPFALKPFSSTPTGASADLTSFAFGGEDGCSPCFEGGYTGIPVRMPDGQLVQGMVAGEGVVAPGPSAKADGHVAEGLSANGEHLIFGSTSKFAQGGNDETGDVSIYDRDLQTEETHVVSTAPAGGPLLCLQGAGKCDSAEGDENGISELAISANGSRVLLGQKVSEDAEGNAYWRLYMDINDAPESVGLTPGATDGVLFDGMTEDGSKVFFTTKDALTTATNQDTDHSADLYQAEVSEAGQLTLTRVSTGQGGAGNSDTCDPVSNYAYAHWNVINGGPANCGVVAIGGGGGVASKSGAVYFLSPELLDGSEEPADGVKNAPNLFLAQPGSAPRFVATLESSLNGPHPALTSHAFLRSFGAPINPGHLATDSSDGDLYVAEGTRVLKFNSSGEKVTSWGEKGVLTGAPEGEGAQFGNFGTYEPLDLTVGPGNVLYVMAGSCYTTAVFEFAQDGTFIKEHVFPSSECFAGTTEGGGIGVDAGGDIYMDNFTTSLNVYSPSFAKIDEELTQPYGGPPEYRRNKAFFFDSANDTIYVLNHEGGIQEYVLEGPAKVQGGCTHLCEPTRVAAGGYEKATDIAVDGAGNIYLEESSHAVELNPAGEQVGKLIGAGELEEAKFLAVSPAGDVYVGNPFQDDALAFAPSALAPDPRVENPAVIDGVGAAEVRHTGDFQVTPDGRFAAFTSTLPLTGFESGEYPEAYRFDASKGGSLACASCDPTGVAPSAQAELASDGLSLTDDGRVFFTSAESLALRDADNVKDVYEWEEAGAGPAAEPCAEASFAVDKASGGCLGLVSSGLNAFDSGLLGVSADGADAFFFTRDSLAPQDHNGTLEKIYDAREEGGFPFTPPPVLCKASDECHGPGSPAPPPPDIHINTGNGGNVVPPAKAKCKPGFVEKHGECAKKPHPHKHPHRKGHRHV